MVVCFGYTLVWQSFSLLNSTNLKLLTVLLSKLSIKNIAKPVLAVLANYYKP